MTRVHDIYPSDRVVLREVGLRDGLQLVKTFPSTAAKKDWIVTEYGAGVRHFEVGSFLPAKTFPQFADVREMIPDHPPSYYLGRLHFDSMLYEPRELAILIDRRGPDRVLLGTDYPYDMGEDDPVGLICSVEGLSDAELSLILGGNAARLLNLEG